jgi:hypothetical protein
LSVIKVDLKNIQSLKDKLVNLASAELEVGWFEGTQYNDGTPVAGVAAVQEFGSASRAIPPRPFFRPTITEQQGKWAKKTGAILGRYIEGSLTPEQSLNVIGSMFVGDVQDKISTINSPKLSPITIALRRLRDNGVQIGGSLVGQVAQAIADGETAKGELGDQTYPNIKPLNDTGYMLATLTYTVRT